ncbi:MAG: ATPase [Gammaproteobacteria bacterium]|nr:ATPase [Gammaproteobacteria bacterium]
MSDIEYCGARFYRCALQVNPANYAEDYGRGHGLDGENYNEAILEKCIANRIEVVGLADHGSVDSSRSLRKKLEDGGITVFPGFEIASSEKIHMVCLYPEGTPENKLNSYLGQVMGTNIGQLEGDKTYPSTESCEIIANIILHEQRGFWYAAHMTGNNGLLRLSGPGDNYKHLWINTKSVIAGQIPGTVNDLDKRYKDIIENKNPDYKRERTIAIINAKDVCSPEDLDENSSSCLVKMTHPKMDSFRNAFYDHESRIRLNTQLEKTYQARIISISWEGLSFFRNEGLAFSKSLNAIIGGHGTGKSTLIESIRYALDISPKATKNADLENTYNELCKRNLGGAKVSLRVQSNAQHQRKFTVRRRHGEPPEVFDNEDTLSNLTVENILPNIEIYSQNEILEIARDRKAQIEIINRFLPDSGVHEKKISEIKERLVKNRRKLQDALENKDSLERGQNQVSSVREEIKQFKQLDIEEKLKNISMLAKEEQIIRQCREQIARINSWLKEFEELFSLEFLGQNQLANLPNKGIMEKIAGELGKLQTTFSAKVSELSTTIKASAESVEGEISTWDKAKREMRDELTDIIAQLPDQGGKSGQEIAQKFSDLQEKLFSLEAQKPNYDKAQTLVDMLENERQALVSEYKDIFFQRSSEMGKIIEELNTGTLKNKIKIELTKAGIRDELKAFLKSIEGIGKTRIGWVDKADDVFPVALAEMIKNKSKDALLREYKSYGLTDGTAQKIIDISEQKRMELEEVELEDKISIYLNVKHEEGKPNFHILDNLSTGQKCIAILNILLLENQDPLIMDQPEDNLDNAFIAQRIVKDLRKYKDKRQFIFATHNANIPVNGDADLIAVLQNQEDFDHIEKIGSIDEPEVKMSSTRILDGGKTAFQMRKEKYGF